MCLEQYKTCMKSISKSLLLYTLSFDFVQYNAIFIPPHSRCGSRSVSPSVRLGKSFLKSPQVWTMDWLELLLWAGSPGKRLSAKHTVTRPWMTASARPCSSRWPTRWRQKDTKRPGTTPSLWTIAGWTLKGKIISKLAQSHMAAVQIS